MKDMLIGAFIGVVVTVSIEYYNYRELEVYVPEPVLSKCDSIHLANDSLVQRMEVMDRRLRQYQIGLWFLRDKNKQAYDYVINAGNLDFKNEW